MTSPSPNCYHATLAFERICAAPIARVFAAFADPASRAQWSAPAGDVLIYDESDFTVNGRDVFRCGPKSNPRFRGETRYHDIVTDQRIVSTETIDGDGLRLAVFTNTVEFMTVEGGTKVMSTVQLVSFVGPGMADGAKSGNNAALDNLERTFQTHDAHTK